MILRPLSCSPPVAQLLNDWSFKFGLYHKTEKMKEGRSVYVQSDDMELGENRRSNSSWILFSDQGIWKFTHSIHFQEFSFRQVYLEIKKQINGV